MRIAFTPAVYTPLHCRDQKHHVADVTFEQLVKLFEARCKWDGPKAKNNMYLMAEIKSWADCVKQGPLTSNGKPNRYAGHPSRCNANVVSMSALVHDIDNKHPLPVIDPVWFVTSFLKCKAVIASSGSSTLDHPRCRVVVPLTRKVTGTEYYHIQLVLLDMFAREHPGLVTNGHYALDRQCRIPSQAYYFPQHSANSFVTAFPDRKR
jgi:hypothetical protein